eukprot:COSAG06_NODE_635_length_13557_cov_10.837581_3_plen_270_part_00
MTRFLQALQSDKRGGLKEKGTSCYCGASNDTRVYVSSSSPFLARKGKESVVLCQDRLGTTLIMRTPQQNDRFSQGVRLVRPVTAACAVRKRRRKQNSLFGTHCRTNSVCACPEPVLARSSRFSRDERLLNKTHLLPFRVYRCRFVSTASGTGTRGDPEYCVWPCGGDPTVACGGGSYMWGANSVYNVTKAAAAAAAAAVAVAGGAGSIAAASLLTPPPPPPPGTEGSGDSAMAVVINGVRVFSRCGYSVFFASIYTKTRVFTKTGSGQA